MKQKQIEYRLDIISDKESIIENLKELIQAVGDEIYQHYNGKANFFVSKRNFELYSSFLENEGFAIHLITTTGKSIQMTFAGILVCIDSTLNDNEFYYLLRYKTNEFRLPSIRY